jgi:hypothetical protein
MPLPCTQNPRPNLHLEKEIETAPPSFLNKQTGLGDFINEFS